MAKSLNRGLGALAALGALSYHLSRGRGRTDGGAPVEDRSVRSRPQEDPMGLAGVSDAQREAAVRSGMDVSEGERVAKLMAEQAELRGYDDMYADRAAPAVAPVRAAAAPVRAAAPARAAAAPSRTARPGSISQAAEALSRVPMRAPEYTPPPMTEEMRQQAERQAISPVYPEEFLAGGPGLRAVHSAAKSLAARTAGGAERSSAPFLRELPAPTRQGALPAPQARQGALPAPQARLTGPSKSDLMARDRAAREAARREEMLRENAAAYGLNPNAPGYEAAMRALRKDLGGSDFTLKKKGGAIKAKPKKMASGGVSSASKRADGIASKGKTKCKMY